MNKFVSSISFGPDEALRLRGVLLQAIAFGLTDLSRLQDVEPEIGSHAVPLREWFEEEVESGPPESLMGVPEPDFSVDTDDEDISHSMIYFMTVAVDRLHGSQLLYAPHDKQQDALARLETIRRRVEHTADMGVVEQLEAGFTASIG